MKNIDLDGCIKLLKNGSKLDNATIASLKNFRAIHGESILHFCAIENDCALVKASHKCGIDINSTNKFSRSALMESSILGYSGMVKLLVELGANISQVDREGNTALHLAYINKAPKEIINLLLDLGADPQQTNEYGEIPEKAL